MQGTAFLKQNAVNLAESGERIMNKWNRDWSTFDWRTVQEGLNDNDSELGLTKAEYLEYVGWIREHDTEVYSQLVLYVVLRQKGFPKEDARYWSAHAEELRKIMDYVNEGMPAGKVLQKLLQVLREDVVLEREGFTEI